MTDDDIKQIFFYCDQHEPNAIIADEVDIVQFARKIAAFIEPQIRADEHQRCTQIASDLNTEVGKILDRLKP